MPGKCPGRPRPGPRIAAMTMPAPPTVRALLEAARARVDPAEAELLLAHALGRPRGWLYAHADAAVAADEAGRFEALVERRARGE
ncbi:MAG: protein-(glutamine-N5) methyltransferase, release factor-specific, partial [Luteimonas sp.]|nr:protein-(glutamine-N5) methyltransferase, release factor-specific [Luteimonas sp.]